MSSDEGGDPACWAHLFDDDESIAEHPPDPHPIGAVAVDLGGVDLRGGAGAVWSLPHGGDLDANLVHLGPRDVIGAHVNRELDVVLVVVAGRGRLAIDDASHDLRSDTLVMIPKGSRREVHAGAHGLTYLSIHRRRGSLAIGIKPNRT